MICCWELVVKTGFHHNLCVVVVRRSEPVNRWVIYSRSSEEDILHKLKLARRWYETSCSAAIQVIQLYTLVGSTTNQLDSTACPNFRSYRWQAYHLGKIHTQDCQTITSASEYGHPHSISGCSLLHHLAFHHNIDSPLALRLTVSPISTNASFFLSLT